MSILIRGAEAPRICGVCPFERNGWPDEWEEHCMLLGRQVGYFGKKDRKPEDCPIIEVPTPHGRLIDADIVCYQLEKQATIDGQPRAIRRARKIVADAPTIIEAEEGADHD